LLFRLQTRFPLYQDLSLILKGISRIGCGKVILSELAIVARVVGCVPQGNWPIG
jgi:hypothetical protein